MNAAQQLAAMRKIVTKPCAGPGCDNAVTGIKKKRYCSPLCENRAYRRRRKAREAAQAR